MSRCWIGLAPDFWLRLARGRYGRFLVSLVFTKMSFLIPAHRLRETETLLAFHHPRPSYRVHVLLVPKRPYASLMDIPRNDAAFLVDLIQTAQELVEELELGKTGYRLIANGGAYQEAPHLHFHLIGE